ncbi:MAG: UvrD-helicase domain-containing protein [Flavobacteriales bacterium]|nr:UvrD-helicase domain-containing protein [Flavobacteriales bacterium]
MNFTVYKSSAGSGKTYTLVKEYIKLALSGKDEDSYRGILAITFTNKAAKEMRERIIQALDQLSSDTPPGGTSKILLGDLTEEMNLQEDAIKLRCGLIHQSILHNYSYFAISTIDKFVHKIVKTFARDLQISSEFEVELEYEVMLKKAIDQLISQVGRDQQLTKLLVNFTIKKTEEEKGWNIENDLYKFFENLMNEEGHENFSSMKSINMKDFMDIRDTLFSRIKAFEEPLRKIGEEAIDLIDNEGIEAASFFKGANGLNKYFNYLKILKKDSLYPTNSVHGGMEEDKWTSAKADEDQKVRIESIKPELSRLYGEAIELLEKYPEYIFLNLLSRNIYSLAVLNETEKLLENLKKENDFIFISDFNKKINHIVQNEPAPFIYERMGEKYRNFLIDEFQDTSIMQWQNLLPLVENSLSNGNFNMIVGDGKQSIYRFRGGDVEQFVRLPEMYPAPTSQIQKIREQALKSNNKEEVLANNYRSKKEVIDFNNWFFRQLSGSLDEANAKIYNKLEQSYPKENKDGMVQLEVLDETSKEEHKSNTEDRITTLISEALEDGYQWKDIAILCRKNGDGSEIAKHLLSLKIDVISSESLLLSNSKEVAFLSNMLSLLVYPQYDIAQVKTLQYLKGENIIDDEVHLLIDRFKRNRSKNSFFEYLKFIGFETDINRIIAMPLYDTVEELIRIFDINKYIDPYLTCFLDTVHAYATSYNNVIPEFIEWWNGKKHKTSIVIPEGLNAVRILTIHKSKGLEYPVVIFPYANWSIKKTRDQLWVDVKEFELDKLSVALVPATKDLSLTKFNDQFTEEEEKSKLDTINVLYVALTRARDRLYILTSEHAKKNVSKLFLPFIQNSEYWTEGDQSFIQGERTVIEASKDETIPASELEKLISKSWHGRIAVRLHANEMWDVENPVENEDYGNLIHKALSFIHTKEDILPAVDQMLQEGFIETSEIEVLRFKLEQLITNPEISPYFSKTSVVKNEQEILLPDGKSFRPDRVVIDNNIATVVDYKTGKESEEHLEQVQQYARLLTGMGYSTVKCVLIYTETEKAVIA